MKYSVYASLVALLFLGSCGTEEAPEIKESIRPVRFAKVTKSLASSVNTFSGITQSSKEVNLSFKVSGTVNRLNVKVGDRVRKGQVIASLDAVDYSLEYDRALANEKNAETQIKSAQTQRVTTKSTFERIEKLYENNSVPLSEYEQAKASYEAAESQYEAAQAQLVAASKQVEGARNQVSYARLTAPFSGVVTKVMVEENELVPSGNPIAELSTDSRPEVRVGVPETYISKVRKNQTVEIIFSILPDKKFKGTISEVAFSSGGTSTYPITIQIDQPSPDIRPGMAASVIFSATNQSPSKTDVAVVIAPPKAIGEGVDGNFVFVLQKEGEYHKVKKTKVEIGNFLGSGFEVKKGLSEGDLVATAGLNSLLDGMQVKLMR
ncbi:MAG: efflux RND transporter periplasmic adaptor subunit [Bacteroidota bacterium]